jgi:hypothetical protein
MGVALVKRTDATSTLTAEGAPSKQFFVSMITKDISLEDCMLDLLDNAIDGAQRAAGTAKSLNSYWAHLTLSSTGFSIDDNCEGISVETARTYAFHFGRPDGSDSRILRHGIGLYGIGMKRAVFKLGNRIKVQSSTVREGFVVEFEVKKWAADPTNWDFPLHLLKKPGRKGTRIDVTEPNEGVGETLSSTSFQHRLERIIQRDYVRFLQRGFVVKVNGRNIPARPLFVLSNEELRPARKRFKVKLGSAHVSLDVIAGMMQVPPASADDVVNERTPTEDWGWYVLCNDRVVLAADKTTRTGWGTSGVPAWHAQYNGFVGWTSIGAADPKLLPWSTTKREMDVTSPVYREALAVMREFSRQFTQYTNQRKRRPEATADAERRLKKTPLQEVLSHPSFSYPKAGPAPKDWQSIRYQVTRSEFSDAIDAFGAGDLTPAEVGRKTFDYFISAEG